MCLHALVGVCLMSQVSTLKIVISFLSYDDIESLRNCCLYLHNFTKQLRLSWSLFPSPRRALLLRVVDLFVEWAKIGDEGFQHPEFPLLDSAQRPICPRFRKLSTYCLPVFVFFSVDRSQKSAPFFNLIILVYSISVSSIQHSVR
jgi:hypothetical protein